MRYVLRLRPEVALDLETAAKWYDERDIGLGADFLTECKATLDRIVEHPASIAASMEGIRSCRIRRFPYVIHYRLEGKVVVVFAIMFGGRDPSAWFDRV